MKTAEKKSKHSIRFKLFVYFASFTALMLIALALFELVFLDDFYKSVKQRKIRECADIIESNIDQPENLESLCSSLSSEYRICICICDRSGAIIQDAEVLHYCYIHRMNTAERQRIFSAVLENGGIYTAEISNGYLDSPFYFDENWEENQTDVSHSLVYIKALYTGNNIYPDAFLMLNSSLSPMSETVSTLTTQLFFIGGCFILLALLFSLLISKKITSPIIRLNNAARKMAKGDEHPQFAVTGYREIEQLSQSLAAADEEIQKTENLRRELIANISHDLRTPLTLISGYSEMMRDIPGENTAENAQIIVDEAKRLSTLVNDVIDLSKLESGQTTLHIEAYNLTQNISDIVKRQQKLLESSGYSIKFSFEEEAFVYADAKKIEQVIYNLIGNAVLYSGEQKRIQIIQSAYSSNQKPYIRIDVIDSGEGIAKEKLPFIWDRYYRADTPHKRATVGSGIGLSIVKNILLLHNAPFGVESEEGRGSDFWFALPCNI